MARVNSTNLSDRSRTKANGIIVLTTFVLAAAAFVFGEKIGVNEGFGWDGKLHGTLARTFPESLAARSLSVVSGRFVPAAIVHYLLSGLSVPLTSANIVRTFGLLNVLLITVTVALWCRICDRTGIGRRGK